MLIMGMLKLFLYIVRFTGKIGLNKAIITIILIKIR